MDAPPDVRGGRPMRFGAAFDAPTFARTLVDVFEAFDAPDFAPVLVDVFEVFALARFFAAMPLRA